MAAESHGESTASTWIPRHRLRRASRTSPVWVGGSLPAFSARLTATEIVSAPKVYGFDTGFVCYYRGWQELRSEDLGVLWEHFVLNEIMANLQTSDVHYWRDKRGHEVDFVLTPRRGTTLAIEYKLWLARRTRVSSLSLWKDADPDISLLQQAKAKYATLQ